jgi:hypothetical protein
MLTFYLLVAGDIRSRLIRLIPEQPDKAGIKALFSHRLPSNEDISDVAIKQEWCGLCKA